MAKKTKKTQDSKAEFITCNDCNGIGVNIAVSSETLCPACDGSGKVEK